MSDRIWTLDPGYHGGFNAQGTVAISFLGRGLYRAVFEYRQTGLLANELGFAHNAAPAFAVGEISILIRPGQFLWRPVDWSIVDITTWPDIVEAFVVETGGTTTDPHPKLTQWATAFENSPNANW